MDANELTKTIGRLRRAQPRNADMMAVCDALERLLRGGDVIFHGMVEKVPSGIAAAKAIVASVDHELVQRVVAKFDKKAYQRELMRARRAAAKGKE